MINYIKQKINNRFKDFCRKWFPLYEAKGLDFSKEIVHCKQNRADHTLFFNELEPSIANDFIAYSCERKELHSEYLYIIKGNFFIEPEYSWIVISKRVRYISESQPYPFYPKLSFIDLINLRKQEVEKVISLWKWHFNYYHFIIDILGQIALFERLNINEISIPFTLPEEALKIPYVKEVFSKSETLLSKKWIIQKKGVLISTNEIYIPKAIGYSKENINGVLKILGIQRTGKERNDKIFLTRGKNRNRRLSNSVEIENLAKANGFKLIDTDELSVEDQIDVFSNSALVIGIHGAGLTNIIFRNKLNFHLVEIFPLNYKAPYYYWICKELGFQYTALYGSDQNDFGEFAIDAKSFRMIVRKINNKQQQ